MLQKWFDTPAGQVQRSLDIVRVVIALIVVVHPISGIWRGDVPGFGTFLSSLGFPLGVPLAWLITLTQIACSLAMIARRFVALACLGHIVILSAGIVIEHARHGWYVVGDGRNGMEYSVTLITCLFAVLWAYWPPKAVAQGR